MQDVVAVCGEGVMLRRKNSLYERTRSTHSRKLKSFHEGFGTVVVSNAPVGVVQSMQPPLSRTRRQLVITQAHTSLRPTFPPLSPHPTQQGYTAGHGLSRGEMGSLRIQMANQTTFTCGTGLTSQMRREFWPPRGTLVEYKFHELTRAGLPRFPVYLGVAHDRTGPRDAVVASTHLRDAKKEERSDWQMYRAARREERRSLSRSQSHSQSQSRSRSGSGAADV